jgi:hypothetical protein
MDGVASRHFPRLVAAVVCVSTALTLSLALPAAADDPLGDVVEEAESAIDDPVADATGSVSDSVDAVSEVVSDPTTAGDAVDDVTNTTDGAGDAVDEVVTNTTDGAGDAVDEVVADTTGGAGDAVDEVVADTTGGASETVADVGDALNDANGSVNGVTGQAGGSTPIASDGSTGPALGSTGGSSGSSDGATLRGGPDGDRQRVGGTDRKDRARTDAPGARDWVWEPADRLESTWANIPVGARVEHAAVGDEKDPCLDDPALACLGILFGMGRYAQYFSSVLGVVATTGIGVVALIAVALALGTSGSAALVAAHGRSAATAGRG